MLSRLGRKKAHHSGDLFDLCPGLLGSCRILRGRTRALGLVTGIHSGSFKGGDLGLREKGSGVPFGLIRGRFRVDMIMKGFLWILGILEATLSKESYWFIGPLLGKSGIQGVCRGHIWLA